MFTDTERQHILEVKEQIIKGLEDRFLMRSIPSDIYHLAKKGILTGGAIASYFHKQQPNDYDIYLHGLGDIEEAKQYFLHPEHQKYITDVKHNYIDTVIKGKYYTANAITLVNGIQFIILSNSKLREMFDFVHCMPYIDLKSRRMVISENQYRAIVDKKLICNPRGHAPRPERIQKYLDRGYDMTTEVKNILMSYDILMPSIQPTSIAKQPPPPPPPTTYDIVAAQQEMLAQMEQDFKRGMDEAIASSMLKDDFWLTLDRASYIMA